jgi:hypothetical protein
MSSTTTDAVLASDAFVTGTHRFMSHLGLMVDEAISMAETGDIAAARRGLHQVESEMFAAIAAMPAVATDDGAVSEALFCAMSSWLPRLDLLAHLADELGTRAA